MESKKLSDFSGEYDLILDSREVSYTLNHLPICEDFKKDITGIVERYSDNGVLLDIWATESNAPYLLDSEYMPIDYWRNCD